jgi:hypothetical protein
MSWSDGVRLTHSGLFNDEVALLTDTNGNLLTVSNQYNMDLSNDAYEVTDVKLVATNFKTVGSLDITDVTYSNDTPRTESTVDVTATIKNTGLKPAKGYTLDVYEQVNGEVKDKIYSVTADSHITPSSSDLVTFEWTMPESYDDIESLSLYMEVNEADTAEITKFTSDSIEIKPVYDITNYEVTEQDDGFVVSYSIENVGNADSVCEDIESDDKLVVKFNDIYYTNKEVAAYLEAPIGGLAMEEIKSYTMPLDIDDSQFEYGYTNAYIEVQDTEGNTLSDSETFTIALEYPYNIVVNGDEELEEITLKEGETLELSAEYSPSEFYVDGIIGYSVDDASVAYIDGNVLTAVGAGETTLNVIVAPYGGYKTISVVVEGDTSATPTVKPSSGGGGGSRRSSSSATATPTAEPTTQTPAPSIETAEKTFDDVKSSDWFYDSVKYTAEKGYFAGTGENTFEPSTDVTRGMLVTVLGRMEGISETNTKTAYSDVDPDMYYASYIDWATRSGIVEGYGNNLFGPDDKVTREQMAKMIANYFTYKTGITAADTTLNYTDANDISEWAKTFVGFAGQQGILNGNTDGTFAPSKNATRAEIAAVIERLDKLLAEQ